MNQEFYRLLAELSETFGPCGCEKRVAELIEKELLGVGECFYDKKCNFICHVPGKGKKTVVISHMDEVSFMVTDIDENGYIRVSPTCVADPGCFLGKEILVGNEEVVFSGIGGGKVLHLTSGGERSDYPAFDKYFIDLGAGKKSENKDGEEKREEKSPIDQIEKGDLAIVNGQYKEFPNGYIVGKALEARIGVALAVEAAKKCAKEGSERDLYFIFSVKEKAGYSGAVTASYAIDPEEAIVLSYIPSNAFDGVDEGKRGAEIGQGVGVAMKDGRVLYYDSPLYSETVRIAKEKGIAHTLVDGAPGDSTGAAHIGRTGLPMVSLRVPCYNPETCNVIAQKNDIEAMAALLEALI